MPSVLVVAAFARTPFETMSFPLHMHLVGHLSRESQDFYIARDAFDSVILKHNPCHAFRPVSWLTYVVD